MRKNIAVIYIAIIYIAVISLILSVLVIPASAADTSSLRVMMTAYSIDGSSSGVASTGEFTLNYTLENMSATGITNAAVSYDQKNMYILPVPGSPNNAFIGSIPAGGEYSGSLELYVPKTAQAGICRLDIYLTYNSSSPDINAPISNTFAIYIDIDNSMELEFKKIELFGESAAGEKNRLLIEYENPGLTDFKDMRLVIDGNIAEEQKSQILPILKAGRSNSIEYYLQFTETGEQEISIYITYSDDNGSSFSTPLTKRSAVIHEAEIAASDPAAEDEAGGFVSKLIGTLKKNVKTPEFAAIIVVMLLAASAVAVLIPKWRKHRKKKHWYYKNNRNGG